MLLIKKIYPFILLLLLVSHEVVGSDKLLITEDFLYTNIIQNSDILTDTSAVLRLEDILEPNINIRFKKNTENEPYFGYGKKAVWIRFVVTNASSEHKVCYLRYPYPILRNISVYQFGLNNTVDSSFAGYAAKSYKKNSSNIRPIIKIHLLPSEIKTIYARFDNKGTEFPLPLQLHSELSLLNSNEYSQLIYGIMYGLIIFILLANAFLYINLRKKIYSYFILYVFSIGFYFSIRDGIAFKYFWNYSEWISSQALFIGAELPIIFLLAFTQIALKTRYFMPRANKVLLYSIYINVVLVCISPFFKIPPYFLCNITVIFCFIPITYISVKSLQLSSLSLPRYFLVAIIFLGVGTGLLLLKNIGVVNYMTGEIAVRTGFLFQLVALSFGLTAMFKNILKDINSTAILNLQKLNHLKDQVNIELESQVNERTQELAFKNIELTNAMHELGAERDIFQVQRDLIKKQTDETTDSIRYAERLQNNLTENCTYQLLPFEGYFILNRPKAIVSGDFYWVKRINNTVLIAVADCTGHGVPGAFMSILGITYLNDIVSYDHETEPDKILFSLRRKVIESFSGAGQTENTAKDGMDISLISIDLETYELKFSGAYNPVYIVRKTELFAFSGDKMPISVHERQNLPFTVHNLQLQKEDKLYLFSDGYVDQFGWRTGKKFKHNQFKQILLELNDVPIEGQKSVLERTLNNWIGDTEQVDDIMVMGIKI